MAEELFKLVVIGPLDATLHLVEALHVLTGWRRNDPDVDRPNR